MFLDSLPNKSNILSTTPVGGNLVCDKTSISLQWW